MPTMTEDKALSTHAAVPPPPGECPDSLTRLTDDFTAQLQPGNLLERHYVEKIAAASWRLRRLHRWQAQMFEDETLTEDERLNKLERVLRHETNLNRQIDTAVKMLNRDVPHLYADRAQADPTPNCQNEPAARNAVAPPGGHPPSDRDLFPRSDEGARNGQNEPGPASSESGSPRIGGRGVNSDNPSLTGRGGEPKADTQSCSPEHSRGGSACQGASLTLTANGRLVPTRMDAARRLLDAA